MNTRLDLISVQITLLFHSCIARSLNSGCTLNSGNLTSKNDCSISDNIKCQIISNCCYPDDHLAFHVTKWPRFTTNHPHNLTIVDTGLLFEDKLTQNLLPAVEFAWTFPDDDLSIYHTGFLINVIKNKITEQCDIFDLSGSNLTKGINFKKMVFHHTMYGLDSLTNYMINVTSLPFPGNNNHLEILSSKEFISGKMISKTDRFSAADWTTDVLVNWNNKSLYVTFKAAPQNYKFNAYNVILKSLLVNTTEVVKSLQIHEDIKKDLLTLEFSHICSGTYYISLRPVEQFQNDDKKCLCRNLIGTCVDICRESLSSTFQIVTQYPCPITPSTLPSQDFTNRIYDRDRISKNRKLIYISMALFSIATLICVVIIVIKRQDIGKEHLEIKPTFQYPENSINIRISANHINEKSNWKL